MKNASGKTPRTAAAELLIRMSDNAYSNLVLDSALSGSNMSSQDKAFVSRLFYGVTERRLTLDYILSLYSKKPLPRLDKAVLAALRCGLYQILYMDSVPDSAAVNESAETVKNMGHSSAAGYVNGILRSFIRDGKKYPLPEERIKRMSVEYSCPEELISRLLSQHSEERVTSFLEASLRPHRLYLRANSTIISGEGLVSELAAAGTEAEVSPYDKNCVSSRPFGQVEENELFRKGFYHVQDLSSQLCCKALGAEKGELVLDICAAPGGKSFTIAEDTGDDCTLYSCDLHSKRVGLIRQGAERLGLKSIKALQNDAKAHNESFPLFDKILCDVPCSGYGVIRSKPEIKYSSLKDAERLPEVQYSILSAAAEYLRPGGEIVYSTCTVLKEENDLVIDRFLEEHPEFEGVSFLTELGEPFGGYKALIMGGGLDCEGMFISKIRFKI